MTYGDILDTIVMDSGDDGTRYRTNMIRWLNLARQEAAARGSWKSAKNSAATLTTNAANTSGIYALIGFEEVIGGEFYDQTGHIPIVHDTENQIMRMLVPEEFGPPVLWADAGMTAAGEKQVRFWPIPTDERVLAYLGSKALIDIEADDEGETIDAYFGSLSGCGVMLQKGLRYYHDLNNNEDISTVAKSESAFHKSIVLLSGQSGVDANASTRMDPVNRRTHTVAKGRLDPAHYSNR